MDITTQTLLAADLADRWIDAILDDDDDDDEDDDGEDDAPR